MKIDDRDLRVACSQESAGLYERLAQRSDDARLAREYEVLRKEVDRRIALDISIDGNGLAAYLENQGCITALWAKMDKLSAERFGEQQPSNKGSAK